MNETMLDKGFGQAVIGVGDGPLEQYSRYREKTDRLLATIQVLEEILSPYIPVRADLLMGNKGIINATKIEKSQNLTNAISQNMQAYESYFREHSKIRGNLRLSLVSDHTSHIPEIGKPNSDLVSDGTAYFANQQQFPQNGRVGRILTHESLHDRAGGKESTKVYEPYGFAFNYGLAGMVLRQEGVDMLIGVDKPGSYLNHLYHTFIQPDELYMEVAK